jgi:hypothetical protein
MLLGTFFQKKKIRADDSAADAMTTEAQISSAAIPGGGSLLRLDPALSVIVLLICFFSLAAGYSLIGVSLDYDSYKSFYTAIDKYSPVLSPRFEVGFVSLMKQSKTYLELSFPFFYALVAAIALSLKFRLLSKYTDAPACAAIVYLMMLYPLHEYTQIRAALGIALAFTSIDAVFNKRIFVAVLLAIMACLIHSSAAALIVIAMGAWRLSRWAPVNTVALLTLTGVTAPFVVSKIIGYVAAFNPILEQYLKQPGMFKTPNIFSVQNILFFCVIASSIVFQRPWQRRKDYFFFILSALSLILLASLIEIPILARRISELLLLPFLFYTFRFDGYHRSRIPAALMTVTALWMLYKSFAMHMLSL